MIPNLLGTVAMRLAAEASSADDLLKERVEPSPKGVAAFIERRAACNHLLGEEPYDRQRANELKRALRN
ncbi:hypothetical protein KK137_12525 [Croceibacterium sp. LX-88]|uniref:Uncharacterized protein n=1 Tax=Croceibacterium selenioxidans TaxID=2838833 RepID=A0ABS5W5X9_9SPHN|nr:hypothetical protein [Croceibacterium selenioxidans]MBT2135156.1 hypothetical protein [Croceibacterium selenioxidans]